MISLTDYGNISFKDARDIYMHIEKEKILQNYTFPTKPGKDGYYRIYVTDTTKKTGRKQLFAKSLEELKEKVYNHEISISGYEIKTFEDVFEAYIAEKLRLVKNPEKKLSRQNTVSVIRSNYKRFFSQMVFVSKPIHLISKKDIEEILLFNLERYDLRDRAFQNMVGIVRCVFRFAFEQYWVAENTFERVDPNKFKDMTVPDVDIEKRVHTNEELSKILNELHKYHDKKPNYTPAWALELQIHIGGRRGELAPLRRSDLTKTHILIKREQLTVKKNGDIPEHFIIVEHTKTYKNRAFPRTDSVNEYMARLEKMLDDYYPGCEYLFPDYSTDNGVINNNVTYKLYSRICKKLGIKICRDEIKGPHSFRRNAITDVVNSPDGTIVMAAELFGNSPDVARKNYYTGVDYDKALNVLNGRKLS